jgi:hypothetical protein
MPLFNEIGINEFHRNAHFQRMLKTAASPNELDHRAEAALGDFLGQVPALRVEKVATEPSLEIDLVFRLKHGDQEQLILQSLAGNDRLHTSSQTDHVLAELQLYGYRPFQDEPDPRPLPEAQAIVSAVAAIFDALAGALNETRLEPDLEDLLWSTTNMFHRAVERVDRELDANELAQKRSKTEQDGSEIRSVELERLTAEGITLIERRDSMELLRDQAAEEFERHTRTAWRPRSGSMVNRCMLTSAMIDSRDFIDARRRADAAVLLPAAPKIAFTGGMDSNDRHLIWDSLDKVRGKHPDMVLLHGGSPKRAERIAACWADNHKVPQIAFKPEWTRHGKSAPFKRNDAMLEVLPIGAMVFPGSGIQDNLADKARPVWRFG